MAAGLIRRSILAGLLALSACAASPSYLPPPDFMPETAAVTRIFLVRHAEKAAGDDPALTPAGRLRASALVERLSGEGVVAIWSTQTRRTEETARPLAVALGVDVNAYDPSELAALASRLKATRGAVLVVGHSNTTDVLAGLLGADPGEAIDEAREYDRMYVISINAEGGVHSRIERYGRQMTPGGAGP